MTVENGLYIIPWTLIYYFFHYIEKSRKQQLDTLKLEALVKELELKTIKSHINPHFIFNALNSIRALIDENPLRARTAITELSNILRSSMQTEKQETVFFEKELNIVKDYLALEHIRFEDRLQVQYEIAENTLMQPIPPMMLQTLGGKCNQTWHQQTGEWGNGNHCFQNEGTLSSTGDPQYRAI